MAILKPKNTITIVKTVNALAIISLLFHIFWPSITLAKTDESDSVGTTSKVIREVATQPTSEESVASAVKPDKIVHTVITAYTSTADQTDSSPFITASGRRVHDGTIAANWLPFGTIVKIPSLYGDKEFVVEDRMNKRYGYGRLDIWFDASRAEAKKFGVKRVDIEIYYPAKALAAE